MQKTDCLMLTAKIVASHVGNNPVKHEQLPGVIMNVYRALVSTQSEASGFPMPHAHSHPAPFMAPDPTDYTDIGGGETDIGARETESPIDRMPRERQAGHNPAVDPKRSVFPDYIICLEDGKRLKTLKRHLSTSFKLTPDAYRARWNLPRDYPMVAPNYTKSRSEMARKIGLGRTGRNKPTTVHAPEATPRQASSSDGGPKLTRYAEGTSARKAQRRHAA